MPELQQLLPDSLGDTFSRSASPGVNIAQLSTPSDVLQTIKERKL